MADLPFDPGTGEVLSAADARRVFPDAPRLVLEHDTKCRPAGAYMVAKIPNAPVCVAYAIHEDDKVVCLMEIRNVPERGQN